MLERVDVKPIDAHKPWDSERPGIVERSAGRQLVHSMFHIGEDDSEYEYSDPEVVIRLECTVTGSLTEQETWDIDLAGVRRRRRRLLPFTKFASRESFSFIRAAFAMLVERPDYVITVRYGPRFERAEEKVS